MNESELTIEFLQDEIERLKKLINQYQGEMNRIEDKIENLNNYRRNALLVESLQLQCNELEHAISYAKCEIGEIEGLISTKLERLTLIQKIMELEEKVDDEHLHLGDDEVEAIYEEMADYKNDINMLDMKIAEKEKNQVFVAMKIKK